MPIENRSHTTHRRKALQMLLAASSLHSILPLVVRPASAAITYDSVRRRTTRNSSLVISFNDVISEVFGTTLGVVPTGWTQGGFLKLSIKSSDPRNYIVEYKPAPTSPSLDSIDIYCHANNQHTVISVIIEIVDSTGELPEPLRTIHVRSSAELSAALSGNFAGLNVAPAGSRGPLQPGDHIVCAPGTYAGTFTMSVGGTQTSPIFIKRSTDAGAVSFTGKFNLRGAWCGLHRLRFTGDGTKVDISGRGGRVTRCLFDGIDVGGGGTIYFTGSSHPDLRIDRNEFRSIVGAAIRSEITDAAAHQNMRIEDNFFNGHSRGGDNEAVIMILTDAYADAKMFIGRNLFLNCLNNFLDEKEIISVKISGVTLVDNTFINCNGGFISLRVSSRSVAERNWLEDGSFIKIHGDDHVLRGNRSTGKLAELHAGNCTVATLTPSVCSSFGLNGRAPVVNKGTSSNPDCAGGHPAVRNCLLEHNIGSIVVGQIAGSDRSFRCSNTTLRNNDRAAIRNAGGWTGITETGIGQQVNSAVRLTPVDVGPNALSPIS